MTTATKNAPHSPPADADGQMSHRQILEAMSGLLLSMFVAMLSSTVVSNALPRILHDLHGGESAYTWVVTATLLAMTATTPIWGKLSDLIDKKLLVQIALVIYVAGSVVAGLSTTPAMLIACRAVQGIGGGGILAMTQVILAAMISPRERGRYSGYLGAVFAIATITGPLIGGVIVDTSWLGWRWCFYVGVPFAIAAVVVLQLRLRLPAVPRRSVTIDYLGATLIMGGVSLLLVWVSLAGNQFAWGSAQTLYMVAGGVVLLAAAVFVELRAAEPIIPLTLFRHRTVTLATLAGLFIGVGIYGATIFLSQYFQISRGKSPTSSGLHTMPMILGLALSSLVVGRLITKTGRWKRFLVVGTITAMIGFGLLGTIDAHTGFPLLALYMALVGIGLGATMQNLVLAVQNTVPIAQLGSATATVSFFRSLGGAIGVSALGAVLASHVRSHIHSGLVALHLPASSLGSGGSSTIPDVHTLPGPVAGVVQGAYGTGTARVFLIGGVLALAAALSVLFIKEAPLRQQAVTTMPQDGARPGTTTPDGAAHLSHETEVETGDVETSATSGGQDGTSQDTRSGWVASQQ